jgi:hypothetical protein
METTTARIVGGSRSAGSAPALLESDRLPGRQPAYEYARAVEPEPVDRHLGAASTHEEAAARHEEAAANYVTKYEVAVRA